MTNIELTDSHRAVLRALANTIVPSLDRPDDPTGFWRLSGSDLQADAVVAEGLLELPEEQLVWRARPARRTPRTGIRNRVAALVRAVDPNVALMGAQPAAAIGTLKSLMLAVAYAGPDPQTGCNPMWAGFGYPGACQAEARCTEAPQPFVP